MSLSMMNYLDYGDVKPKIMTITPTGCSITYPYSVLEGVLVKVNDLLFLAFFYLDMDEDVEIPLLLGRLFLVIGRALIDVKLGELMLIFQYEHVIFNMCEVVHHQNKNPQCYRVDVFKDIVEELSQSESPLSSIE